MKKILLILTSFFFFASNAWSDDVKLAKDFVNDFGNKIIKVASNNSLSVEQKRDQLIKLIDSVVDAKWVSKFILAKNYRNLSQEQKDRFENLYRQFMIQTYAPSFKGYNGEGFEVTEALKQGQYFMVKCLFVPKEGPKVNLSFRLKKESDGKSFALLDVIAEGVSLVETQRSEFGSIIASKGIDALFVDLEERIKKLKNNSKVIAKK